MVKNRPSIYTVMFCVALTACAHRDAFPMRNPQTGKEVVCHSGAYWIEEGDPQMRVLEKCFEACQKLGYREYKNGRYLDKVEFGNFSDLQNTSKTTTDRTDDSLPPECLR